MKDKRIGMLMGGGNAEHEVSLRSGAALAEALRRRGYQVIDIVVDTGLARQLTEQGIEVAFVALHGRWGEDGCVQGLLECLRISYTGSGVLASALAMDKIMAKKIFRLHGLPLAEEVALAKNRAADFTAADLPFGLPAVIKPSREGSSVGISIVRHAHQLGPALQEAARWAGDILIEKFVPGREISVAVLDGRALGAIEIRPAAEFYDYRAKYHSGGSTQYLYPAPVAESVHAEAHRLAEEAFRVLGCQGVARVDMLLGEQGLVVLELNSIPGMTEASLVPKIAAGAGISFEELAERLLLGASLKA